MLTNTITTAAALRPRSESPTGAAFWQLPGSITGNAVGVFGFAQGNSSHDATLMVGADARRVAHNTAKQDRPPRGVPR